MLGFLPLRSSGSLCTKYPCCREISQVYGYHKADVMALRRLFQKTEWSCPECTYDQSLNASRRHKLQNRLHFGSHVRGVSPSQSCSEISLRKKNLSAKKHRVDSQIQVRVQFQAHVLLVLGIGTPAPSYVIDHVWSRHTWVFISYTDCSSISPVRTKFASRYTILCPFWAVLKLNFMEIVLGNPLCGQIP
jgi:hypothetical protein